MAVQTLTVHTAFFPASARRSFHITLEAGDLLIVEQEHEHGVTTRRNGVLCFLLDEEVYKYCQPKTLNQASQTSN